MHTHLRDIGRMLVRLKVFGKPIWISLDEECDLNLFDQGWKIYSVNPNQPPQYISPDSHVKESLINEGCTIEGEIEKSVLFQSVTIGKGSRISESVIMSDTIIGENCYIEKAIVPSNVTVPDGTVIRSLDDDIILVTNELLSGLYPAI